MCAPACHQILAKRLGRRAMLAGTAAGAVTVAVRPRPVAAQTPRSFERVVDLTHRLPPDFPTYFGTPGLEIIQKSNFAESGFNLNEWHLNEHTGTHLDAPLHFSADGLSADALPVENLVVPIAVIDIAQKAESDADAQVTPDDVKAWIDTNGPLPDGGCVAMHSGWASLVDDDKFRNVDADGVMHFPGFHAEATQMLMEGANLVGMAVDTLSLDFGKSQDFASHYAWLPTGRWGLENVANLSELPANGATIVVGAPTIAGATGGPSRIFALI